MLSEHDATRLWQRLFRGQTITTLTLDEAEVVLDGMHPESPLRFRLSTELEEIRCLHEKKKASKAPRDSAHGGR